MTYDLTGITSDPASPITGSPTTFTPTIVGSGVNSINWIIRPSLSIDNQSNGGTWGGGRGFVKISCDIIITDA